MITNPAAAGFELVAAVELEARFPCETMTPGE